MGQAQVARLGWAAGRAVAAAGAVLVMVFAVSAAAAGVDHHAVHLCRWPARLSCRHGTTIWELVPIALGAGAFVGAVALAAWVVTGRDRWRAWAFPVWLIGFVAAVLVMRPVELDWVTLLLFAGYAGLGIELTRRLLAGVVPGRALNLAAVVAWLAYAAVVAVIPGLLAEAAIAEGLRP